MSTSPATERALPVYLDYAATTPVDPAVAKAMLECLEGDRFGNPSSVTHVYGRRAAARVEAARAQVARLIGAEPDEIIFTSGATEASNLAILGVARANADRGRHIVTTRIEHKAVLDPCRRLEKEGFQVTWLTPDRDGRLDPEALLAALRPDTILVSIMHVNNEIGVVNDIAALAAICAERGIPFHTDAAQSAGRLPLDVRALSVDFLSFTAHKLYGPQGIGALYIRRGRRALLQPILFGGGQERGLRPGTLPVHQIVGFGAACELAERLLESEQERLQALCDRLWSGLRALPGVYLNGAASRRVPGILNVSFEGVEGESLVTGLTELALSTGAACDSASGEPSYVLRALGRSPQLAQSALRFGLGRFTTAEHIDLAISAVQREVTRLRAVSPASGETPPPAAPERARVRPEPDVLSAQVRRLFEELPGAGTLPPGPGVVRGEAGGPTAEAWVRFHLQLDGDVVRQARFQAYGCPHTLAVASWLTGRLPGRSLCELVPDAPAVWAETLEVPVEKLGRLLIIEDALRACLPGSEAGKYTGNQGNLRPLRHSNAQGRVE